MDPPIQTQAQRVRYLTSREFNILFAKTVQRFPCIWNRNLPDSRSINMVRHAWQKVAKILGHGLTSQQCQTRWRSLRNSYTAHLRKEARNGTNNPHLDGVLEYIRPHTTSGVASQVEDENGSSSDCEVVEEPVVSAGTQVLVNSSNGKPDVTTTTGGCYYEDARDNLDDNDYADAPAACQHVQIDSLDGDALFLLSVLPEMEAMNEEQKRSFKETVKNMAERFMD